MGENCISTQLIYDDGEFNKAGLESFIRSVDMSNCNLSYAVVAIMGPQSSGKSTLLNHLFSTNFAMMDAANGRNQTTKGIWVAKAVSFTQPLTIIMDIEGNDGKERGEDIVFEKRSSLYALALADIVLINMWHNDIGRENGANKPLLRSIFEAMTKLFSPRKTTLIFVIRDTDKDTPVQSLNYDLIDMILKIWDNVPKPEERKNASLQEFFNVKVIALSHFKYQNPQFQAEVAQLREQFKTSITPGGLAGDSDGRVPGSAFSTSAESIWEVVKDNKDLDLPAHKKLVSAFRCDAIAGDTLSHLAQDEGWLALEISARSGPISDFGKQLSSILKTHLSEYDMEARYFDEGVRDARRLQLESNMLALVQPTHATLVGHLLSQAKVAFETQLEMQLKVGERFAESVRTCKESCLLDFDKQCQDVFVQQAPQWDATHDREELMHDIEAHSSSLLAKYTSDVVVSHERKLLDTLEKAQVGLLLVEDSLHGNWCSIRELIKRETEITVSEFVDSVSGFELDDVAVEDMKRGLRNSARSFIEKTTRQEAGNVATHMMNRFTRVFNYTKDFIPRLWNGEEDIILLADEASIAGLKILSVMAVIRLEETSDNIQDILFSSLIQMTRTDDSSRDMDVGSVTPLLTTFWEEVSPEDTIITPAECLRVWRHFLKENGHIAHQASIIQKANKAKQEADAAAEAARLKIAAKVEESIAAAKAETEAVGALARAKAATERVRSEAAVEAAEAASMVAVARAEAAQATARAEIAEAAQRYQETLPDYSAYLLTLLTIIFGIAKFL